jgi:hypothetical protein
MGPEEVLALEREWLVNEEASFVSTQLKMLMLRSLCCLGTHQVGSFAKEFLVAVEAGSEEQKLMETSRVLTSFETPQWVLLLILLLFILSSPSSSSSSPSPNRFPFLLSSFSISFLLGFLSLSLSFPFCFSFSSFFWCS